MAIAVALEDAEVAVETVEAFALAEPLPIDEPPVPGDPDEAYTEPSTVWASPRSGPDVRLLVQRTVTHEHVGELRSALVEEWDEDVDQPPRIVAEASSWDPLWEAVAHRTWERDGYPVHELDPKGFEVVVWADGKAAATGVLRQPIDIGGGRVMLPAVGPEALWDERTLGFVEQFDHLEGWGDFERYPVGSVPPGTRIVPDPGSTMEVEVVADAGVRGRKALRVRGAGWVESPRALLLGQAGVGRTAEGSAFGRWSSSVSPGLAVVQTVASPSTSATALASVLKQGLRPDVEGWSIDPVASGAVLTPAAVLHSTYVRVAGFAGVDTFYDLVRLQQGVQSGSLVERPYSWYADRFLGDLQNEAMGGASWGMRRRIVSRSRGGAQIQVSHNSQPRASEVMRMVTDVDGGAAVWVDPSWTARIMERRGRRRTDVAFNESTVIDCRWAQDPGAEVDEFVVDTGRGYGTSLVTSTVVQPRVPGRHRIARFVRAPGDWPINRTDAYARQQARANAQRNITAEVDVRWSYGRRIGCGDTVPTALVDGQLAAVGDLRVLNRRMRPRAGVVTFTIGVGG